MAPSLSEITLPDIFVDFEVFKALTALRRDEKDTESDVIRRLLQGADPKSSVPIRSPGQKAWISKGVVFPVGTELRARYKGEPFTAKVEPRGVRVQGQLRPNLSLAAKVITGTSVNGWAFWEVRFPNQSHWTLAKSLRPADDT